MEENGRLHPPAASLGLPMKKLPLHVGQETERALETT